MEIVQCVRWSADGAAVCIVDQRLLPEQCVERALHSLAEVCEAIQSLAVRGAPAIGIVAAMGLVVSLGDCGDLSAPDFQSRAAEHAGALRATRPTAVNLSWALNRLLCRARTGQGDASTLLRAMRAEADCILAEDRAMCRRIGELGQTLIPDGARVLTHCNTGALATGGIGTALAAVYCAAELGRRVEVLVDETRPLLQGSRLTAWELTRAGIPVTVLADGAAPWAMKQGMVDLCLVGADRIAANGDVANKIGTYAIALAARHHNVPFYVAAPSSTFDPATPGGSGIVIEQRPPEEIRNAFGKLIAPMDADVFNPAFDVTPAALVTAIVSDVAIHRPPFDFRAMGGWPAAVDPTVSRLAGQ